MATFFFYNVEQGLCTKPSSHWSTNRLIGEGRIFVTNLDSVMTTAASGSICHQLGMTAFVKTPVACQQCFGPKLRSCHIHKPKYSSFNGLTDRQQTMIP